MKGCVYQTLLVLFWLTCQSKERKLDRILCWYREQKNSQYESVFTGRGSPCDRAKALWVWDWCGNVGGGRGCKWEGLKGPSVLEILYLLQNCEEQKCASAAYQTSIIGVFTKCTPSLVSPRVMEEVALGSGK